MRILLCLLSVILLSQSGFAKSKIKKTDVRTRSVASLEEDLKTLEAQNKAGNEEVIQAKKDIEEHTAEKVALQEQIDKTIIKRDSLKKTYNDLAAVKQQQLHEIQQKMQEQKKLISQSEAESLRLEKDAEKVKAGLKKIEDIAELQETQLKKSKEHLQASKDLLTEVKKQKEKFQLAIKTSLDARAQTLKDNSNSEKEIAATHKEIAGLKNKFLLAQRNQQAAAAQFKLISAQVANANALNKAEQSKLQIKEDSIADLNRLIKAGKEEVERAKKEHDSLIQKNQKADADKPRLELQASQLKTQYRQITSVQKGN